MKLTGKVWKFARDDINTGMIRKQIYNHMAYDEQAKHCLESVDPEFAGKVSPGDFIVAARNFGCGSSTPCHWSIIGLGVPAVIAESFGPLFLGNCVGGALWPVACPDIISNVEAGDTLEFDTETFEVTNVTRNKKLQARKLPPIYREMIEAGGEKAYLKKRIEKERAEKAA